MYHYYMFNKPFGCVCARRDDRYPTVMDYFSDLDNPDLSPVGRLDRATEGLLLVTDDGMFNQKLTHPSYKKEKTYLFTQWERAQRKISMHGTRCTVNGKRQADGSCTRMCHRHKRIKRSPSHTSSGDSVCKLP